MGGSRGCPDGEGSGGLPNDGLGRSAHILGLVAVLYVLTALWMPTSSDAGTEVQRVAILPFEDRSEFRGTWELDREIPRLWGRILAQDSSCVVISLDSVDVALGRDGLEKEDAAALIRAGGVLRADLVVTGTVEEYNLSRLSVGDLNLGGYRSYSALVKLGKVRVFRTSDGVRIGVIGSERKITDRDVALDLFGGLRERDREFFHLDTIAFGSDRFRGTVIGTATHQVLEDLTEQFRGLIALPPIRLPPGRSPTLLTIQGKEGYLDVGSRDGVVVGHTLEVLAPTESAGADTVVGTVRITTVIGAHLSKVRILYGAPGMRAGYSVRAPE